MINPGECNWVISSVVERLLYTQDAVGSNPTLPILLNSRQRMNLTYLHPACKAGDSQFSLKLSPLCPAGLLLVNKF
jgi:hypothetical protein